MATHHEPDGTFVIEFVWLTPLDVTQFFETDILPLLRHKKGSVKIVLSVQKANWPTLGDIYTQVDILYEKLHRNLRNYNIYVSTMLGNTDGAWPRFTFELYLKS
jgi:hypothetical protein